MERTQGWVAGLVLLLEWLRAEDVEPEALTAFTPDTVFDYFAGELLERIEPDVRSFLLKSAVLPKMTPSMTAALTGQRRAERILSDLHRRNLFITRHTNAGQFYQYHPLLREFLLKELEEAVPQDEIVSLKRQAAILLEQVGRIEPAIELLREAEDWPQMAKLIRANAQALFLQGRGQTIAEWIKALPKESLDEDPWLMYWLGNCLMGVNPQQSLPLFEQAFSQFREAKDTAGVYLAWCGAVESIRYDWGGSPHRWDRWIAVVDELTEELSGFPSAEVELKVAQCALAPFYMRLPTHPKHAYWRERMLTLMNSSGGPAVRVDCLTRAVVSEMLVGERLKAGVLLNELQRFLHSTSLPPITQIAVLHASALYYEAEGDLQACREAQLRGLEIAAQSGAHFFDYPLLYGLGAGAVAAQEVERVEEMLHKLQAHPFSRAAYGAALYHQLALAHALLRGAHMDALAHADRCQANADELGYPFVESWAAYARGQVLYALDQRDEAWQANEQARISAWRIGSRWIEWGAYCIRAYFGISKADDERCKGLLARGL